MIGGYPIPFSSTGGSLGIEGGSGIPKIPNVMDYDAYQELFKALQAGTGITDVANLTGGGALRRQSLEATLLAVIQQYPDFRLWNMAEKSNATATIDEWTEETGIGGFPGGAFNTELGDINEGDAVLKRRTLQIKYLMTRRRVSFVKELEGGIQLPSAVQQTAGALELLTSAEWGLFNGDSAVNPEEFDGLSKIIAADAPDNIVDLEGQPIGNNAEEVINGAEKISSFGNWGMASHSFWSTGVQGDLDKGLDPAFRVLLENHPSSYVGIMKGAPVVGIKSSFAYQGKIQAVYDKFILEGQPPTASGKGAFAGAGKSTVTTPASLAGVAAADTAAKFKTAQLGNYTYAVEAVNKDGRSTGALVKSSAVAVAAGERVDVTVTAAASPTETGYIFYRNALNGATGDGDFREMARVKKAGATTVFKDLNTDIPGTSKAYILNMTPGMQALTVRRLLPMLKYPLYPTTKAEIVWAQLLFFALRIGKPTQHVVLKNILPRTSTFRPFN